MPNEIKPNYFHKVTLRMTDSFLLAQQVSFKGFFATLDQLTAMQKQYYEIFYMLIEL